MSQDVKAAIKRAVDWLRANPDKHIKGELATDSIGMECNANDPDAQCFCVLGRISKELNVAGYPHRHGGFLSLLETSDIGETAIYDVNDSFFDKQGRACNGRMSGNPAVLDLVEQKLLGVKPAPKSWFRRFFGA